jgi:bifunctional enzyme CysN/CysC
MNEFINAGAEPKKIVDDFIQAQENLSLLRFITCGSVDDGKSTLIGRILYESHALFDDQINELKNDSKKHGTQGKNIDYALLVDGLSAEREQGITIDVAYRYFSTQNRKFIVADTPGHEQYTRNMLTGASTADVAVILIDARKGVLEQTKRHSFLVSLVGIKKVILAVNKMDLIDYNKEKYHSIVNEYKEFAKKLNFNSIHDIPLSALKGNNVVRSTRELSWFKGPSLIALLETIDVEREKNSLILPIQNVLRPNLDYRAYAGKVLSGSISVGSKIKVASSGKVAKIKSMNIGEKVLNKAKENQSISFTLDSEIDISRGDVLCKESSPIEISNNFHITLAWLSENECFKGRAYVAKFGAQLVSCQIIDMEHKYDINTLEEKPCKSVAINEICNAVITFSKDVPYTRFEENDSLGKFIIIDPVSNQTVAAAIINRSTARSTNIYRHNLTITRELRENLNGHKGKLLWLTGISGSGKSTIADALEKSLYSRGIRTYILDGDSVRHGLNNDLGFDDADRVENIRRVGEVSKLMLDAGLFVICSFISPFNSDRSMVKNLFSNKEFVEVYIDTPLSVAEARDPKGLYKKARLGEIKNFTGISSPYEIPNSPDITINTEVNSIKESVKIILDYLGF